MSFRLSYFSAALLGLLTGCSATPESGPQPLPTPVPAAKPAPAPAERPPAAAAAPLAASTAIRGATIESAVTQFLAAERARGAESRHVIELIDLNGDRRDDALVLLQSRRYCSARGCALLIFEHTTAGYELHSRVLLGRTPLIAAESRTRGWRDLVAPMTTATAGMRLMMLKHTTAGYPDDPAQLAVVPPTREVRGRVLFSDD